MMDEWNWEYTSSSKEARLERFEEKFDGYIEKIAEWDDFVVYDIGKCWPGMDNRLALIREYADAAWYNSDVGDCMVRLNLPTNKPSVQKEIDDQNNRRTPEEKKASEDLVRLGLQEKEIKI